MLGACYPANSVEVNSAQLTLLASSFFLHSPQTSGKVCRSSWGVWVECSSFFLILWAHRWINHWSLWWMASAISDLRLPTQPQGITAPVPPYWYDVILLCNRSTCASSLPRLLSEGTGLGVKPRPFSHKSSTLTISRHVCVQCSTGHYMYWVHQKIPVYIEAL